MAKKIVFIVVGIWLMLLYHEKWIVNKLNSDGVFTGVAFQEYALSSRPTVYERIGFAMYSGYTKMPVELTRMERTIH